MTLCLHFHGDLASLLRRRWGKRPQQELPSRRAASVKDMVESFGLPRTEVGCRQVDGSGVTFDFVVAKPCQLDFWPLIAPWDVRSPCLLRPHYAAP